jgi:hypothetical protein
VRTRILLEVGRTYRRFATASKLRGSRYRECSWIQ